MTQATNQRGLGVWLLTALVAGNMIGSGVFLLPSALAAYGSIGIFSWIITSIGAILLALVFAQLSMMVPKVGGPYAYCYEGFGEFAGFQIAYNYWIALWVGNAAIVVALVGYLGVFWHALANNHILSFIVSLAFVWFITLVNIISIRQAGIWQLITTILKIVPLILIATVGLFFIHPQNFSHFNITGKSDFSALMGAATLTLWSFIGLESATVPAESVENPTRTIPRATIIGVVITAIIYILSTTAVMGVLPIHELKISHAPYADAARVMFGSWGGLLVGAGAVISCFGALNGWTLLQGQIPFAAAKDGLFPKAFAKQTKSGTPIVGLIVSSVLISILLLLTLHQSLVKQFTLIILLATLSSLIPYLFTTMAEILLLLRNRDLFSPKKFTVSVIIAMLAGIYAYWAIVGSGVEIVDYGALLFFTSIPVYVWMKWRGKDY